jgi:hypothetical protein
VCLSATLHYYGILRPLIEINRITLPGIDYPVQTLFSEARYMEPGRTLVNSG